MKKVKFIFGIHNHQPIGNFDFVFEDAYQKSYLPFLKILEKHPKIRIAIHFTGILLDWLEAHHPELLQLVNKLRGNGQLELMSGGYYEPILSVIPPKDRKGQIQKLTRRVKDLFDYDATGMWLAERVWEPVLPSSMADAGITYTVVDDTHFKYAGLRDDALDGYYVSEDLGKQVAVFPISKHLRYTIPFQEPEATIDVLRRNVSDGGETVVVFADDGEKFGVWPKTYDHVYTNGWLDRFFSVLEENLDWIDMCTFDEALGAVSPKGMIYLPTASYAEMMHWSLFEESFKAFENFEHYMHDHNLTEPFGLFVRGGFWRNFMVKYPEVNIMHKKMLRVSQKLWKLPNVDSEPMKEAAASLWAGQCNCPYWHGVFGGLYLSHLRFAIFQSLIHAEKIIAEIAPDSLTAFEVSDFDNDGHDEILIETALHNAYFKPDEGGMLFEYDFKAVEKNLSDTMTRRREGYHEKLHQAKLAGEAEGGDGAASIHDLVIAKEPGLEKYLIYDSYQRKSLIDHILPAGTDMDAFYHHTHWEAGDFTNGAYRLSGQTVGEDEVTFTLVREGNCHLDGKDTALRISKQVTVLMREEIINVDYILTNLSGETIDFDFAVELNYGLQAGHADDRYYYFASGRPAESWLDSRAAVSGEKYIGLKDAYMRIDIKVEAPGNKALWHVPVETISLSEAGFERVYQSSAVLAVFDVRLEKETRFSLTQKVSTF